MVGLTELSVVIAAALATFFSPCAYALLPGYVGYTVHRSQSAGMDRAIVRGVIAGLGVLIALGTVSGLFVITGARLTAGIQVVEPLVGLLIAVFGVLLVLNRAPSIQIALPARPDSAIGFGLFGAGYAIAAVGCGLPVFIGVIGMAVTADANLGMLLIGIYVGLVVLLMIAVTIVAGLGAETLLSTMSIHTRTITRIAGVVLIIAGLGQIWVALTISPVGT